MDERKPHFLLVTFPVQGHINPAFQFCKQLLCAGAHVTFVTSLAAYNRIDKANIPSGVEFATFSDGYDDGYIGDEDVMNYISIYRQCGTRFLEIILAKSASKGKQVTCIVYTLLLSWVAEVARKFYVPSTLLWIQPATVFCIYYYYFNGYHDVINNCEKDPLWSLKLPNFPFDFKAYDLPSFLLPSNPLLYNFALLAFQEQIEQLQKEDNPKILVNSFEALEFDGFKSIEKLSLIPIGPLLLSAFLEKNISLEKSFGVDLFQKSKDEDYIKWLNGQECSSVIYVSFGSLSVLSKEQLEQLANALIQTHRPFLWVIREIGVKQKGVHENNEEDYKLSCMEQLKQQGLIVPWCSQVEVLSHSSIGCFLTHCGWNSTLESLTLGVPMVAFPQWTDQTTNAKLVQDVWKVGVRVKVNVQGLVKSEEIKRCLDIVMENEEMRENAMKWRVLALKATQEGGSSNRNLKAFMEELFNVDS